VSDIVCRVLLYNLHYNTDSNVGLSDRQFGFRKNRWTDDALHALHGHLVNVRDTRGYTEAVSLDIRNAFNSVSREVIYEALQCMGFPPYIRQILRSYLGEMILYLCNDNQRVSVTMEMTSGILQGSVLMPLFWNIAFNAVFWLPISKGTTAIGYAEDTLVVTEGDTVNVIQERKNVALETVSDHIRSLGLRLSAKSQVLVFTRRHETAEFLIFMEGESDRSGASMKYLGVVLERKRTMFGVHLLTAVVKTQRVMGALGRLMPNVGGPSKNKRRLSWALCILCFFTELQHRLLQYSVALGTSGFWARPNDERL